ncbi:MAG: aldehyde ferredoxin oxidoreductase family protein, partial [Delftia sp.]|nr:aldehyde ferredoxin oxidoreductase family protein [Delftia sp.]
AARLLYDRIPARANPLGPENVLGILTGPLTGTNFPGCGRVSLCALSPLTQGWGQSSMGGYFGAALKRAGWDGILLTGAAQAPSYLLLQDGEAQILDASELWGLDTYETHALLRQRHPRFEVACIGPAGENLSPIAAVAHRPGKLAGRCGMGAVLGSKKIKAVLVRGSGKLELADRKGYDELVSRANEILSSNPQAQLYAKLGTAGLTAGVMMMGDMPARNWSGEIWQEGAEKLSGETIAASILVRRASCHAGTTRCKPEVRVDEGDITVEQGPGPEYEALGSLGTLLRHSKLAGVAKANELCNRLGLDAISAGATIAWAIEAFERGHLTADDGLELAWGDSDAILETIEAIGRSRGKLGALLAQGSRQAAATLGQGSAEYAINVKGLEMAMHHPRVFHGLAFSYACLPQGASHMEGGFNRRELNTSFQELVAETIESMRHGALVNTAIFCSFPAADAPLQFVTHLIESATGQRYTEDELRACADRDYLLRYAFNLRAGRAPADNALPERIVQQMQAGDPRWEADWPRAIPAYYAARGFDAQGYPTVGALREAGLDDVLQDMALWERLKT